MNRIDLQTFFHVGPNVAASTADSAAASRFCVQGEGLVIAGMPRTGKSSLAFQCALEHAFLGKRVMIFCCRSVAYAKLPQPQCDISTVDEGVLGRIEFTYVSSLKDVRRACAESLGLTSGERTAVGKDSNNSSDPSVIVVEDDGLEDSHDKASAMKTLAVLSNTVQWIRTERMSSCFYVFVTNCVSSAFAPEKEPHAPADDTKIVPLPLPYRAAPVHCKITVASSGAAELACGPSLHVVSFWPCRSHLSADCFTAQFLFNARNQMVVTLPLQTK